MEREAPQSNGHDGGIPAEFVRVSRDEVLAEIGREAQRRLGIEGGWQEFAQMYHDGLLPDALAVNELATLLPGADEPRV